MCQDEDYVPAVDKEAFLDKSSRSVLLALAKLRFYEEKGGRYSARV